MAEQDGYNKQSEGDEHEDINHQLPLDAVADAPGQPLVELMSIEDLKQVNPQMEAVARVAHSMLRCRGGKALFCGKRLTDECYFVFWRMQEVFDHIHHHHPGEVVKVVEVVSHETN